MPRRADQPPPTSPAGPDPTRGLVLRFVASGAVIVLLLAVVVVALLTHYAQSDAVDDAKQLARATARGVVEPALDDDQLDPASVQGSFLDWLVRQRVRFDPVVRVKIWRADGTVVYSDEARLVGHRYHLGGEEQEVLEHGGIDAEVSDLSQPENRYDRRYDKLLEVYQRVHTRSGTPLLYEEYLRYGSVDAARDRVLRRLLPAFLGALLLLELLQVPLAVALARRFDAARREREVLLERAVDASRDERRRIARDLHDGVVQRLAGISLGLHAMSRSGEPAEPGQLAAASEQVRTSIGELRTLLVEIYPPSLADGGLERALEDLVRSLPARGIDARLDVERDTDDAAMSAAAEALLFRVAQEAVRNVERHASAATLVVTLRVGTATSWVRLRDDGVGFDPGAAVEAGHVGLALTRDLAQTAGGSVAVDSVPGGGTTVTCEVPSDA